MFIFILTWRRNIFYISTLSARYIRLCYYRKCMLVDGNHVGEILKD